MSRFLLDTDTLSLLQWGHPAVLQQVNARPVADVAVCVISIQEQVQGWQAALNRARTPQQLSQAYDLLVVHLLPAWGRFLVLSFTEPAILRFDYLRSLRLNVGLMDLRIAAVALENGLTVVTGNQRDFGRVPGLAAADWAV
jgi:tRNA(fMet)-specific endonuclease VapC